MPGKRVRRQTAYLIDAMIGRIRQDEAEAKAKAARLFFGKGHDERMSPFDFSEELGRVTSRCFGLCVAIQGMLVEEDGRFATGLYQLAIDLAGAWSKPKPGQLLA